MQQHLKALITQMTSPHEVLRRIITNNDAYRMKFLASLLVSLSLLSPVYADEDEDLPYVTIKYASDFSQLAEQAQSENMIIMLEVSASYCEYCELLEEEFIKPMLRSGDYENVLIRKIDMDSYNGIKNFSDEETTSGDFCRRLKVTLTPTLLFFDGHGNEIAPRVLGINSLDLYGGYLEDSIQAGQKIINLKK